MIADLHLHTRLSPDAEQGAANNIAAYREKARDSGLSYICITEHCDILPDDGSGAYVNADLAAYAAEMKAEQKRALAEARSAVRVLYGIELAHAHTHPEEAAQVLAGAPYDFVLGSLHVGADGTDYWGLDYAAYSDEALLAMFRAYVGELYEIADKSDFDSLAHCTYPLRYFAKNGRLDALCAEPSAFVPQYEAVFRRLIERGKALEINTSDAAQGGRFSPGKDLLRLYRSLGGCLVTVGSDAHTAENLGAGVDKAEKLLRELGFEGVCVFVGRGARILPF